jgi:hypothetical protein
LPRGERREEDWIDPGLKEDLWYKKKKKIFPRKEGNPKDYYSFYNISYEIRIEKVSVFRAGR